MNFTKKLETRDLLDHRGKVLSWGKFYSKKSLGLNQGLRGFLSNYNEGGYALFLGSETETLESVTKKMQPMMDSTNFFLQNNTLAANFILSGYILDMGRYALSFLGNILDYFFSVNLAIEKTQSSGF